MEKKEKINFFKKMFLVITDFRTYPFLVKHEKFYKSIFYLITLTLFITLIFSLNVFIRFSKIFDEIMMNYDDKIPEFQLSEGFLNVKEIIETEINEDSYLVLNTNYTYEEYKNLEEVERLLIYDTVTFVNSDKIIIEMSGNPLYEIAFNNVTFELNKQSLQKELVTYSENIYYKLYLAFSTYISIFLIYLTIMLIRIFFISCIVSIISIFFGIRLNFVSYIKIGIYSYTLPLIIEMIAICLIGTLKDYAYYTTVMLTYVYAIYAIRAIKLDAFIMMFSNKKGRNQMHNDFESELEKYQELVQNDNENLNEDEEKQDKDENNDD